MGSFFTLIANVVTDLVGKITKDYNGLNLKLLALSRLHDSWSVITTVRRYMHYCGGIWVLIHYNQPSP